MEGKHNKFLNHVIKGLLNSDNNNPDLTCTEIIRALCDYSCVCGLWMRDQSKGLTYAHLHYGCEGQSLFP